MKLSLQQHNALSKMTQYFTMIEEFGDEINSAEETSDIADVKGVKANYTENIGSRRRQIFNEHNAGGSRGSIVNLSVIVNEKKF